jgi:hypothetical protein
LDLYKKEDYDINQLLLVQNYWQLLKLYFKTDKWKKTGIQVVNRTLEEYDRKSRNLKEGERKLAVGFAHNLRRI